MINTPSPQHLKKPNEDVFINLSDVLKSPPSVHLPISHHKWTSHVERFGSKKDPNKSRRKRFSIPPTGENKTINSITESRGKNNNISIKKIQHENIIYSLIAHYDVKSLNYSLRQASGRTDSRTIGQIYWTYLTKENIIIISTKNIATSSLCHQRRKVHQRPTNKTNLL